jgi:hypothetical protein
MFPPSKELREKVAAAFPDMDADVLEGLALDISNLAKSVASAVSAKQGPDKKLTYDSWKDFSRSLEEPLLDFVVCNFKGFLEQVKEEDLAADSPAR